MGLDPTGPTPSASVDGVVRFEVARLPKGWTSGEEPVRPRATHPNLVPSPGLRIFEMRLIMRCVVPRLVFAVFK